MDIRELFEQEEIDALKNAFAPLIQREEDAEGKADGSDDSSLEDLSEDFDDDEFKDNDDEDLIDCIDEKTWKEKEDILVNEIICMISNRFGHLENMAERKEFMSQLGLNFRQSSASGWQSFKTMLKCSMSMLCHFGYIKADLLRDIKLRINALTDFKDAKCLSYAEHLSLLPFGIVRRANMDIKGIEDALNRKLFGLDEAKAGIVEHMTLLFHSQNAKAHDPMLLAGPPGVGKTSIGEAIAEALGLPFYKISFAGNSDILYFKGCQFGWTSAGPGIFVKTMQLAGCENFVMLLDEIDKSGGYRSSGEVITVLAELLDPGQSSRFRDIFLEIGIDLSKALFICTANDIDMVPDYVQDRCNIIEMRKYTHEETKQIIMEYLPRQIRREYEFDFEIRVSGLVAEKLAWSAKSPREAKRILKSLLAAELKHRRKPVGKAVLSVWNEAFSEKKSEGNDPIGFRMPSDRGL